MTMNTGVDIGQKHLDSPSFNGELKSGSFNDGSKSIEGEPKSVSLNDGAKLIEGEQKFNLKRQRIEEPNKIFEIKDESAKL